MARNGFLSLWAFALGVALGGPSCATKSDGIGDETHFQSCNVDDNCKNLGVTYRCESNACRVPTGSGGAGGGGGGALGSGAHGGAFGSSSGGAGGSGESPLCAMISSDNGDSDAAAVRAILGDAAAASCVLRASDYDRTCQQDRDCALIGEGNGCEVPCAVQCSNAAINAKALPKYEADYAKTPFAACGNRGPGGPAGFFCGCPASFLPRCVHGLCERPLPGVPPTADAAASGPGDARAP
jgi:hypothetical protein